MLTQYYRNDENNEQVFSEISLQISCMRKIKDERGMTAWRLLLVSSGFPDGSMGKISTWSIGVTADVGGGRSPGRGNGIPL